MYYAVTHLTTYQYSRYISDNVMEIRLYPRNDAHQTCVRFNLEISPKVKIFTYQDYLDNTVQFFDLPAPHKRLAIKSEAIVNINARPSVPDALPMHTWDKIDQKNYERDCFDMLMPGQYTNATDLLHSFLQEIDWQRREDPLTMLREITTAIYERFEYVQHVTKVDSSIDIALGARHGVCQDFAHIMIAAVRQIGIPCRYVSGYLYHRANHEDRSDTDASHAWVEAWLPTLGWIGFDPTNNLVVEDRHIVASIGTDYANAAPTRGLFKGDAETILDVRVKVELLKELPVTNAVLAPEVVLPNFSHQQQQ